MARISKQPQGDHLFSFVVVADTHVNETDDASRSPFLTNVMANNRARHVFSEIAAMSPAPAFIVHLGDIVHPVPSLPGFDAAAARFKEIASQVSVPVHLVPGNHDVGDKTIDWMPADIVCDAYIEKYHRIFGKDYFAFDHGNIRLVIINALLFNSGLAAEEEQKQWLDNEIAKTEKRIFVFTHYPPYLYEATEPGSYDNIDEPGRSWLLERLKNDKVEAVFAGHVHNFWYDVVGQAEMYLLPSTAFLRHDFTEFYRVAAGAEHGRADGEKFGYFIVDVYERGHVARLVRTHGAALAENEKPSLKQFAPSVHTKTSGFANFGVELRHAWSEVVQIPATGGVQEFGRKLARNDYQLMALWEMGVRTLKVPEQDLRDPGTIARAQLMSDVGHDFIVTSLGVPRDNNVRRIVDSEVHVSAFELNLSMNKCLQRSADIARFRAQSGTKVIFSKLRTTEEAHYDGKHFSHFVNAGFHMEELAAARDQIAALVQERVVDGVTVRLEKDTDLLKAAATLDRFANDTGGEIIASVKLAAGNLSIMNDHDVDIARKAVEALIVSRSTNRVRFVFDTFMDVDRGYFPRNGFIDRRFNPRPAGIAVAGVVATLPEKGNVHIREVVEDRMEKLVLFTVGTERFGLMSGDAVALAARLNSMNVDHALNLLAGEILKKEKARSWEPVLQADAGAGALLLVREN